jgi:hypothetical protein
LLKLVTPASTKVGLKRLNFEYFKLVVEQFSVVLLSKKRRLIEKEHLTFYGLKKIRQQKDGSPSTKTSATNEGGGEINRTRTRSRSRTSINIGIGVGIVIGIRIGIGIGRAIVRAIGREIGRGIGRGIGIGIGRGIREIKNNEIIYPTALYPFGGETLHKPYSLSLLKFSQRGAAIIQKREFHHKVKAKNRIGPHNIDTLSIIFGSLLGPAFGGGEITKKVEGCMLVLKIKGIKNDYVQWLYTFFYNRGYTSNIQPRQYTRILKSKEGKVYYGYEFNTFTFRSFSWIHGLFYNKGRKVIPNYIYIYEYLTPLALAV